LDNNGTVDSVYHAGKLGQQIIARRIYHSSVVLLDQGCHEGTIGSQRMDRSDLIVTHEAAVTFDIGTQDRCEFPFDSAGFHISLESFSSEWVPLCPSPYFALSCGLPLYPILIPRMSEPIVSSPIELI
jgi:hypothetical protein